MESTVSHTTTRPRAFDGHLFLPTVDLAQGVAHGLFTDTLQMRVSGATADRAASLALLVRSLVAEHECDVVGMADHTDLTVEEDFCRPFSVTTVDNAPAALAALQEEGYVITWDRHRYPVRGGGLVPAGTQAVP